MSPCSACAAAGQVWPVAGAVATQRGPDSNHIPRLTTGTMYHLGVGWGMRMTQRLCMEKVVSRAPGPAEDYCGSYFNPMCLHLRVLKRTKPYATPRGLPPSYPLSRASRRRSTLHPEGRSLLQAEQVPVFAQAPRLSQNCTPRWGRAPPHTLLPVPPAQGRSAEAGERPGAKRQVFRGFMSFSGGE